MKTHDFIEKKTKKPKVPKLPTASEYTIHCQIAQCLNLVIKKPSRWHTVEVSNHGQGKAAMINQMMDKKKGVTTSWPDIEIFISIPIFTEFEWRPLFRIIFLEVKVPGGKLTEKQEALHKELRDEGHRVFVVYSVDDVKRYLKELGVI
jgi:hypothetical protein